MIEVNGEEFKSTLAKLRPVVGDMADALWLSALLDPERSRDVKAVAEAMVAELLGENYATKNVLLDPPSEHLARGEYPLGNVTYAGKPFGSFGLRENELSQHVLILGRSGAGKTNVARLLVRELLRARKPFLVLDWRGNYKDLRSIPEGKDISIFTPGDRESLSFNPLDPPWNLSEAQRQAYLREAVSVICTTYLPGHHLLSTRGAEYLILRALEIFEHGGTKPVTFNDLSRYIERYKAKSREQEWVVSAKNLLYRITTGPIGRLSNSTGATTITDILQRPVLLQLDSLGSETDRAFFTKSLLLWLYYFRLAEGKSKAFKHVLIIEEAHNLFLRRHGNDQSVHDLMIRQMRDLGQALILLDQNPSLLTTPALGNTGTTICLNLKHGDDIFAAGRALTLPRENWDFIGRLPVGHAIVKVANRFPTPFLVRFPLLRDYLPLRSGPTARQNSGTHSVKQTIADLQSALNEAIRALPESDRKDKREERIAPEERVSLIDIAEHPLSTVTERYKRLGLSAHTGTKIKRRLLEKGLIAEEKVSVPNGSVALVKLTNAGKDLPASWGVPVKTLPKNASLEHEYWKQITAERYRKEGYKVEEEYPLGSGKAVDLVATKGSERIAIEIETGKSDIEANREKCKMAGFSSVLTIQTKNV